MCKTKTINNIYQTSIEMSDFVSLEPITRDLAYTIKFSQK